jgi:hypothetical protein
VSLTHVLSMTQAQVVVSLTAFGFAPRPGPAVLIEQSTGERVRRAFAGLGMFWALALGGLFIPVAHCHGTFALALPERAS